MEAKHRALTVKDVPPAQFIEQYALHLKRSGKLVVPEWADYVKTGPAREVAPLNPDWFYVRTASLARKIYLNPYIGMNKLRKVYGGTQRNGAAPNHSRQAGAKVIRYCCQQLQKMGIVKQDENCGGKKITKAGQQELDRIASQAGKIVVSIP